MTLQEQWQQDVERFGDKAHLMWTWFYKDDPKIETLDPIESNYECQLRIKGLQAIRKQSAALPFDMERAKNGDVVEVLHNAKWYEITILPDGSITFIDDSDVIHHCNFPDCDSYARMKYPPTIKQEQ